MSSGHTDTAPAREGHPFAFAVVAASLVTVFAASSSPVPLFNTYRAEDGLTNADVSLAVATYFAGTIVALLTLGRLANHLGRRVPSILAVALLVAGAVVLLHVPNVFPLMAGRFLMGLGCGLASSALMAYGIDTAPARPPWVASVVTSQAPLVGLTIGAVVSGLIVDVGPAPRTTVYLVMIALLAVCIALLTRAVETAQRHPGVLGSLRPQVAFPQSTRKFLPAAFAVFLATWAMGGFFQGFVPSIVAEQLHTGSALVLSVVFSAFMAPSVVGATIGGRWTPAGAQRIGMGLFLAGVAGILASLFAGVVVPFIIASVVAGIGQGMAMSATLRAMLHDITPDERSPLMAAIFMTSYSGAMVPSLIAGQLSKVLSVPQIALGYGVLAAVGTALVWLFARNPDE